MISHFPAGLNFHQFIRKHFNHFICNLAVSSPCSLLWHVLGLKGLRKFFLYTIHDYLYEPVTNTVVASYLVNVIYMKHTLSNKGSGFNAICDNGD